LISVCLNATATNDAELKEKCGEDDVNFCKYMYILYMTGI